MKKADVERLLAEYDANPVAALTQALRIALDLPAADWPTLLSAVPIDPARRERLLANDEPALDRLATELNERRGFAEHPDRTPAFRPAGDADSARSTDTPPR